MKYPFVYKVVCFDNECMVGYFTESGIGFCDGFADAAGQLEHYYGRLLLTIKNLEVYEDSALLPLTENIIETIDELASSGKTCEVKCDREGNPIVQ